MADAEKVFIVEDDVDLAEMLTAYFRTQGYETKTTTWGEEATQQIQDDPPDVVLLDIRLPDIDGYEVCRRLRQSRRTRHLPVIFLTERREREDKLAGLELGAVDYVTKPFDIHELRLRVRNALRRASLHTLHNPITGLPEGMLVRERLEQMLAEEEWGLVVAGIHGLDSFRERYGFVAADDVTRAVGLMITNTMQESDLEDGFIGHVDAADFVIITSPDRCRRLAERCRARLEASVQYFYPAIDRPHLQQLPQAQRLLVRAACLTSRDGAFADVEALDAAIAKLVV